MLKPAPKVNYLLKFNRQFGSHSYSVKSNFKLSYFVVECCCFEVNLFVFRGKKRVEMAANAQAYLVHEFESPSQYKAVHVAVTKIHAELSGDFNV